MKTIHRGGITGQEGVNLIERVVLRMGFLWNQAGGLEAGIDGYIELRDDATGQAFNLIILVQSKATTRPFVAETAASCGYLCDERDIDYWLIGNAPVILIVSRPQDDEAYWVSLKDYFRDPATRKARRVRFDKRRDRFDEGAKEALVRLAAPQGAGVYLTPPPREETLWSNLLPVTGMAGRIYVADTAYREAGALAAHFRGRELYPGREWLLKDKRLYSFRDLTEPPWPEVCDRGTVEDFATAEWADSDDPERRRDIVGLFRRALGEKVGRDLRHDPEKKVYFFKALRGRPTRTLEYRNLRATARRTVVKAYASKRDEARIAHWRHAAFGGAFLRLGGAWYLEVTPTYHFTADGQLPHPRSGDLLAGIKRLEHNQNVLAQVLMWGAYLTRPADLFTPEYPLLRLGPPLTFAIAAGIDDDAWLGREDEELRPPDDTWLYDEPLFRIGDDTGAEAG